MKNLFKINSSTADGSLRILPFLVVILLFSYRTLAQVDTIDNRIDNIVYYQMQRNAGHLPPDTTVIVSSGVLQSRAPSDGVDVIINGINPTSESSVFIDPKNRANILNSNNSWGINNSTGSRTDDWESFSNGTAWISSSGTSTPSSINDPDYSIQDYYTCDPSVAIDRNGNYYIGYLSNNSTNTLLYEMMQHIAISNNNGGSWTLNTVSYQNGKALDKNDLCVDNSVNGHNGYLYDAWTDFTGVISNVPQIEISRSIDALHTSWSTPIAISASVGAGFGVSANHGSNQGIDLQTGADGALYAVWGIYDDRFLASTLSTGCPHDPHDPPPPQETALGFVKITNYPTIPTAKRIIFNDEYGNQTSIITGARSWLYSKNCIRINSFPSLAVDVTNTDTRDNIYVVWANEGDPMVAPSGSGEVDIYMLKSTDGGNSWNNPIPINTDNNPSGFKKHFLPRITCDKITGALSVVYYDDRNCNSTDAEVWVSNSIDAGATWTDFKVSDCSFTPAPANTSSGYFTDYIGIESQGGNVYPCWNDNSGCPSHTNTYLHTYVSPYHLCKDSLNIVQPVHVPTYYEVEHHITCNTQIYPSFTPTGGCITTAPISGDVTFDGTDYVELQPGFETQIASNFYFEAYIDGCMGSISRSAAKGGNRNHGPISKSLEKSINANLIDKEIHLYPNPNNGVFTVSIKNQKEVFENVEEKGETDSEEKEDYQIYVYDVLGNLVYNSIIIEDSPLSVDLTNQPNGLYLIKISQGIKLYTTKFLKQ